MKLPVTLSTPPPDRSPHVLRIPLSRELKNACVRAARPGKLTPWILRTLAKAAGVRTHGLCGSCGQRILRDATSCEHCGAADFET